MPGDTQGKSIIVFDGVCVVLALGKVFDQARP